MIWLAYQHVVLLFHVFNNFFLTTILQEKLNRASLADMLACFFVTVSAGVVAYCVPQYFLPQDVAFGTLCIVGALCSIIFQLLLWTWWFRGRMLQLFPGFVLIYGLTILFTYLMYTWLERYAQWLKQ